MAWSVQPAKQCSRIRPFFSPIERLAFLSGCVGHCATHCTPIFRAEGKCKSTFSSNWVGMSFSCFIGLRCRLIYLRELPFLRFVHASDSYLHSVFFSSSSRTEILMTMRRPMRLYLSVPFRIF